MNVERKTFEQIIEEDFKELYIYYADKLPKLFKEISELGIDLEERKLSYRDNSYGITEIISCPIKARLRREGKEPKIEKFEIADGFIFETIVKFLMVKIFGKEKVEFEKLLQYDLTLDDRTQFKIDGHLDVFINYSEDTKIGLEIKNTVLQFDNILYNSPPPLIILNPDEIKRINISPKYILQASIQKFILEKMYPGKNIKQYLLIKTNLKTRWKLGKSIILYPVVYTISEDKLKEICYRFKNCQKPRAVWECKVCSYKDERYCSGFTDEKINNDTSLEIEEIKNINDELIIELLDRKEELEKEIRTINEELKKRINGQINYKGKTLGWVDEEKEKINPAALNKLLKEKGIKNRSQYFIVNPYKKQELKKILKEDYDKIVIKEKRKKFKI